MLGQGRHTRIPYWFHVDAPKLAREPHLTLTATGIFSGTTAGKPRLVRAYRYPEGRPVPASSPAPSRSSASRCASRSRTSGAVIGGRHVSPRVVYAGDENRLTGDAGYPEVINPYIDSYGEARPVAAAIRPAAGSYDIVFDTPVAASCPGRSNSGSGSTTRHRRR